MTCWKVAVLVASMLAAVTTYGRGICPGDLYPNPPDHCYPCLGCTPCCTGCSDYCQDPKNIAVAGEYRDEQVTDLRFLDGDAEWNSNTTTVEAQYRPRRFTLANSWVDPSLTGGLGHGDARLTIAGRPPFDSVATVFTAGAGLHWTHWNGWGSDLDAKFRKVLDSDENTSGTAAAPTVNSVDYASVDIGLSVRYGIIPGRLTLSAGVRSTYGNVVLEQALPDSELILRESADFDRQQFVVGAELRFTRSLSATVQAGTGDDNNFSAVSLRYAIGGGRRVASRYADAELSAVAKPKIKFKWHGRGQSCDIPLGICLSIPIGLSDASLTAAEIEQGYGFAEFQIVDRKLIITPQREAALPDGTIVFDHDKQLEPDLAKALGYRSVVMKAGVYRVDRGCGEFGRITVDVLLER